jgi:hypothetical protein
MSAKKPKTRHAKALRAYVLCQITKAEYQDCCFGYSYISGACLVRPSWGFKTSMRRLISPFKQESEK